MTDQTARQTADLTAQLTEQYGDVLPPSLIERTVVDAAGPEAAAGDQPPAGDQRTDQTARDDVAALAEAVARRGSAG